MNLVLGLDVVMAMGFANETLSLVLFAAIGAVAGIFLFLDGKETFTWRGLMGRAGTSATAGASAAAVWLIYPNAHIMAVSGVACALGSFGVGRISDIMKRFVRRSD